MDHDRQHERRGRPGRGEDDGPGGGVLTRSTDRRGFLRWAGAATAGVALVACSDATAPSAVAGPSPTPKDVASNGGIDLGRGDIGILNYAFALEQLESAFYAQVMNTPYSGMTTAERGILSDIRNHEKIHAKFYSEALATSGIPFLALDFSSIDFTSRASVLTTAKAFEDTGVSAYNGAGQLLTNAAYLLAAGKIVSVEARHAAAIRDLLQPRTGYFAGDDVIDAQGLDLVRTPAEVLTIVAPYFKTPIDGSHLPSA